MALETSVMAGRENDMQAVPWNYTPFSRRARCAAYIYIYLYVVYVGSQVLLLEL